MLLYCFKLIRKLICLLTILLIVLVASLHLPVVQQILLRKAVHYLHTATHYHIQCDTFRFTWLQHITLKGVKITDPQKKTLVIIDSCKGSCNLFNFLLCKPAIIDSISIVGMHLYVEKNQHEWNIQRFCKAVLPFVSQAATELSIRAIQCSDCYLSYYNPVTAQTFKIDNLQLAIANFVSISNSYTGTITLSCGTINTINTLPLTLQKGTAHVIITPSSAKITDFKLYTKYSVMHGDFKLQHVKQLPLLGASREDIMLEVFVRDTTLASAELSSFSDYFKDATTLYKVNGRCSLTPHLVTWQDCVLTFGSSTIASSGEYNRKDNTIAIVVSRGQLYQNDLPVYIKQKIPLYLAKWSHIGCIHTSFIGNKQQAKVVGHITTPIGSIQTNCILENLGEQMVTYQGTIGLHQVDICSIFPQLPITAFSAEVALKGKGIGIKDAHIEVVAHIAAIQSPTYTYKAIEAACTFTPTEMTFKVDSKDPNALLRIIGRYHLAPKAILDINGMVTNFSFYKLGITDFPLVCGTKISLQLHNILGKYPKGRLCLNQCVLQDGIKKIESKQIMLQLVQKGGAHSCILTSPFVDGRLQGSFTLLDLGYHMYYLIGKWKGNSCMLPKKIALSYRLHFKDSLPFLHWFSAGFFLSANTILRGHCSYDQGYHFSFHVPIVTRFSFKKWRLENAIITLKAKHCMNPKKRFVQLAVTAKAQGYKNIKVDRLALQLLIDRDKIAFSNNLSLLKYGSKLFVACRGSFEQEGITLQLLPTSRLTTKNKIWTLHMAKPSLLTKGMLSIGELSIKSGEEAIYIGGQLSERAIVRPLYCVIRHVTIDTFWEAIQGNCRGIMDANLVAHWQSGHLVATGMLQLQACSIKKYPIGTFKAKVNLDTLAQHITLEGVLHHAVQPVLQVNGLYRLLNEGDNLQFTATLNQMDLQLLNPLVTPVFSEIEGQLSGTFQVTGNIAAPMLQGSGQLVNGKMKINYLNTVYHVRGSVQVHDNLLLIERLWLGDMQEGHATFSGQIALQEGFQLRLSGKVYELQLLDTSEAHQVDFYGTLYTTGDVTITGPIKDLLFNIAVTAHKGTFTVRTYEQPNRDPTTQLVRFIYNKNKAPQHSNKLLMQAQDQDQAVVKVLLYVTILPSVQTKIVFNPYNKRDLLKGRGEGKIQLEVGTHHKPRIIGSYLFQSGSCTISVYNLMQKTFAIVPNSQIIFNGYVQESVADIRASYEQMVTVSNGKRSIPVEISLSAYGPFLHPHITYTITFLDKGIEGVLYTQLAEMNSRALLDASYRNKQILSVLITKRIYDEQKVGGYGWDALYASINDLLGEQLQNLASTLDHNLAIETDLGIDRWEKSSFVQRTKIKISYLLFSEQLKLSSTFGRQSMLINDWEISYRIPRLHNLSFNLYQQPLEHDSKNLFGIMFTYTKRFG